MSQIKVIVKKLISGSILRVISLGCNMGVSFFIMPFLIHSLGDRWYGFWALIGTFMGYYGFFDLGLSSAVSRFVSRAYGQKDYNEMNTVINTSLVLFGGIAIILILITFLVVLLCPYFINSQNEISLFRKIIIILGANMAISFPMRAFAGVLAAKLRYDYSVYIELFRLFIRTVLVIYFISKGYGILALAMITFVVELIGDALTFSLVRKEFAQLKLEITKFKAKRIKSFFNYSKYSFIVQVADHIKYKIDLFVIAAFLNVVSVTHYYIAIRLIEFFANFVVNCVGVLVPVFSQYESQNDFNSIRKFFVKATQVTIIISVFTGASMIFYGDVFIEKWMGNDFENSYYVLVILCIPWTVDLMQNVSYSLLFGISKHHYQAALNSLEAIANVILSITLVHYYGIYGVALGTAIPMLFFRVFIQPFVTCQSIDLPIFDYYFNIVFCTFAKIMIPLLLYFSVVRGFLKADYVSILVISFIQILLFIPIAYFCFLNKEERQFIRKVMHLR